MIGEPKTIVAAESAAELDEVWEFIDTLDSDTQKSLLDFIQGAKFMRNLMTAQA